MERKNEWPLLIFTLLMQASIGLSVMLGICAKRLATTFGGNHYVLVVGCVCALIAEFMLRYCFYTIHI
ncbi:hypothetical protein GKR48_00735 [Providencia sp. wls1943]|uniref:hypothetical protein n=1 Tax=Providencia sp. wls1943 TaxID=2675150 RepID=UPI0012B55F79|nr:hypothetical protein [Providencia sp. wls1943]